MEQEEKKIVLYDVNLFNPFDNFYHFAFFFPVKIN